MREQTSGRSATTAVSANPVSISPPYPSSVSGAFLKHQYCLIIKLKPFLSPQNYGEDFFGEDEEYLNSLDVNHPESPYGLIQGTHSLVTS